MDSKKINPQDYTFSFRLGTRDCFKLRTGTCSLFIQSEEYRRVKEYEQKNQSDISTESSIDYCRDLANDMAYWKEDINISTGINAQLHSCGHISFIDGQHRSCITKKIKMDRLVFAKLTHTEDKNFICGACHNKQIRKNHSILKKLFYKLYKDTKIPNPFLDDEYL